MLPQNQLNYLSTISKLTSQIRSYYLQELGYSQKQINAFMLFLCNLSLQEIHQQQNRQYSQATILNDKKKTHLPETNNFSEVLLQKMIACPIDHEKLLIRIVEYLEEQNTIITNYYASSNKLFSQLASDELNEMYPQSFDFKQEGSSLNVRSQQQRLRKSPEIELKAPFIIAKSNNPIYNKMFNQPNPEQTQYTYSSIKPYYGNRVPNPNQWIVDDSYRKTRRNAPNIRASHQKQEFQECLDELSQLEEEYKIQFNRKSGADRASLANIEEGLQETLKRTERLREHIKNQILRKQNLRDTGIYDEESDEWGLEGQENQIDYA